MANEFAAVNEKLLKEQNKILRECKRAQEAVSKYLDTHK